MVRFTDLTLPLTFDATARARRTACAPAYVCVYVLVEAVQVLKIHRTRYEINAHRRKISQGGKSGRPRVRAILLFDLLTRGRTCGRRWASAYIRARLRTRGRSLISPLMYSGCDVMPGLDPRHDRNSDESAGRRKPQSRCG